jgi:hypothetical protein
MIIHCHAVWGGKGTAEAFTSRIEEGREGGRKGGRKDGMNEGNKKGRSMGREEKTEEDRNDRDD